MKLPIIATILLILTGPAFADEKRLVQPEPEHRRDWTILYNWQLTKDKTVPFFYWQQFDTEQECLDELHDLQKQGPKRVSSARAGTQGLTRRDHSTTVWRSSGRTLLRISAHLAV